MALRTTLLFRLAQRHVVDPVAGYAKALPGPRQAWARSSAAARLGLGFMLLLLALVALGTLGTQSLQRVQRSYDRALTRHQVQLASALELHDGLGQIGLQARQLALQTAASSLATNPVTTAPAPGTAAATATATATNPATPSLPTIRLLVQEQARVRQLLGALAPAAWGADEAALATQANRAAAAVQAWLTALDEGETTPTTDLAALLVQRQPLESDARNSVRLLIDAITEGARLQAGQARADQARAVWQIEALMALLTMGGAVLAWALLRGLARVPQVRRPSADRADAADAVDGPATPDARTAMAQAIAAAQDASQRPIAAAVPPVAAAVAAPAPPATVLPVPVPVPVPEAAATPSVDIRLDLPADSAAAALATLPAAPTVSAGLSPAMAAAMPALHADLLVSHAVRAAERGGEIVSRVVTNMEGISNASRQISEVLSTIDSIAFQTNILALNAAVQSAKAGHGNTGFGAVAGEVRGLAQRAAAAAKEIKGLIHATVEKTESGARLMRDAGITMDAIVSSVQSVTELVGQIASNPGAPAAALIEADRSVQQLDRLTSQNLMLVEQSGNAADALREQAERLQKVVGAFRLLQQTQEAAWTAHTAIHSARSSSARDGLGASDGGQGSQGGDAGDKPHGPEAGDAGWGSF